MDLFIVRHQHSAECCLAADPYSGAKLLNYLNQPNARENGIGIRGEAIVRGEHTLYLIVEAIDEARLREFMQPFAMAGTVDVYPAGTCAELSLAAAVARRGRISIKRFLPSIPRNPANGRLTAGWSFAARTH